MSNIKKSSKRSVGYFRYVREKKIRRKERIIRSYRPDNPPYYMDINDTDAMAYADNSCGMISPFWYEKHRGKLSKGKIHCSCPLCRYYGPSISEKKRMLSMADDFNEYTAENDIHTDGTFINKLKIKVRGEKMCLYNYQPSPSVKEMPPTNVIKVDQYKKDIMNCA